MYLKFLTLLLFCLSSLSCATPERIKNNLDKLFQHCHDNDMFNGHVLIYKDGTTIYSSSYGQLSYDSPEAITEQTPFLLASLSKQFTAMAIVSLKSQGLLNYEDPVANYLHNFPYQQVSIRHLLNQSSGIPEYQDFLNERYDELVVDYNQNRAYVSNQTISEMFASRNPELEFTPGSSFNYSNTNYIYLAQLIEEVSGVPYRTYLQETFFEPLNMTNTWVADTARIEQKRAIGYKKEFINETYTEHEAPAFLITQGDGGIYSSAQDILTWFLALDTGEVISNDELSEAYTLPLLGEEEGPYGFGYFVRQLPFNGNQALTHSGEFAGFSNAMFRDLDANTSVIMLSNNSHHARSEINSAVIRILYGVPFDLPKISAETLLSDMILSGKIIDAKQFYTEHADNESYDLSEDAFNKFGYELLYAKKYHDAVEVLKWNVEMHPKSSNVYDSLGEAYLESGDNSNALKYYTIAYDMNSKNQNAKKIIDRLSRQ